jgi:biopolymer transport protein ExbB
MRSVFRLVLWLLAGLLAQPLLAHDARAWWNGDWPYRMKITADASPKGAAITEPIGRTQILLRLHSGNFNFQTVKDDGADLRFVAADDRTPLKFHIARIDPLVDQVALVWIDVPDLAPGAATSFYMYWGNDKATAGGDPHATYDPDQVLVYHFGDENGLPKDLTGFGNNALTAGKRDEAGITGFALRLDGAAPVRIPASASLAVTAGQSMTWSMWVRPDDGVTTAALYAIRDGQNAVTIGLDKGVAYAQIDTATGSQRTTAGAAIGGGAWHLLTVTAGDKLTVYVDGEPRGDLAAQLPAINGASVLGGGIQGPAPVPEPVAAPPPPPPAPAPAPATKGGKPAAPPPPAPPPPPPAPVVLAAPPPPPNFAGLIDEFQVSKVMRPLGAIQLAPRSQGSDAKLLTFDTPEQTSAFGSGFIGIIVRSVTLDAWVVIGILGVMFVVSWVVMIAKALFIGRQRRANKAFMLAFHAAFKRAEERQSPLALIAAEPNALLRTSPLFKLYDMGRIELDERLQGGRLDADGGLLPQSLAAIRAAVDAVFVMEMQRLNGMMVILTIAIAGGPFIGLLGTVIGVMITFASIAAAGDVNVNAIAPGISAALLATVAGLAVAIPALFGYNYFTVRIREISAEMQIFLDEMITRMAEGVRVRALRQPAE